MSSVNVDYLILTKVRTLLNTLIPKPDVIQFTPVGKEKVRPPTGATYWVNLTPKTVDVNIETSNSYVHASDIEVTVCVEDTGTLDNSVLAITEAAANVTQKLIYSTLEGYLRRTPNYTIQGYSAGETSSIYYYTITIICEKQI